MLYVMTLSPLNHFPLLLNLQSVDWNVPCLDSVTLPCSCRVSSAEWQIQSLDCSQHHGSQAGWGEKRRRRVLTPSLAHRRPQRLPHQGSPLSLPIQSLLGGHSDPFTPKKVRKMLLPSLCSLIMYCFLHILYLVHDICVSEWQSIVDAKDSGKWE